jgi:ParB-like chromosome segregation protein Spo0J
MTTVPIELVIAEHSAHYPHVVRELAELLKRGFKPSPISCLRRAGRFVVQDGHHRYEAHLLAGCLTIDVQ